MSRFNKQNVPLSDSTSRRNSQSIGKIIRNKQRKSDVGLTDMTPDKNMARVELKSYNSKSAIKKRLLDEKYRTMLNEYETKNRQLDSRMKEFESSGIKTSAQKHYHKKTIRALPILMTSDFNLIQHPITMGSGYPISQQKPRTVKRHETECLNTNTEESQPIQHTEPENKKLCLNESDCMNFVKLMKSQIDLQEQLRKWKNRVSKKMEPKIAQFMEKHGISKEALKVEFEQYEVYGRGQSYPQEIVQNNILAFYKKCQEHWHTKIKGHFTREQIKRIFKRLDYDGLGMVSQKVFARELSILGNRNFRIRDVYRICRRLSSQDSMTEESMSRSLRAV